MKHAGFLMAAGLLLATSGLAADDGPLHKRLRIDHASLNSAERDYHERRQRGVLSGVEAADYAGYVARLFRQVAEDCVALAEAGFQVSPDLGCPSQPLLLLAPAAIDQAAEQTVDEEIAAFDAELFAGLGEFDEMLLREQERIRAAAPMTDPAGGGGAGGGEGAEGAEGTDGAEGESGAESAGGDDASYGRGAGRGAQRQDGTQGTPRDIPDGSDDDVVARQLREAAEKETDPVLKKKLWEEYRKYKQGTR